MHHGTCECRMRSEGDRERKPVLGTRLLDTAGPCRCTVAPRGLPHDAVMNHMILVLIVKYLSPRFLQH
jgi:hypothetical protein